MALAFTGKGSGSGGSTGGWTVVRYSFSFNTPNILTGALIGHTPAVGDALVGWQVSIPIAFNGTSPALSVGAQGSVWPPDPNGFAIGTADLSTADAAGNILGYKFMSLANAVFNSAGVVASSATPLVARVGQALDGSDPVNTAGSAVLWLALLAKA